MRVICLSPWFSSTCHTSWGFFVSGLILLSLTSLHFPIFNVRGALSRGHFEIRAFYFHCAILTVRCALYRGYFLYDHVWPGMAFFMRIGVDFHIFFLGINCSFSELCSHSLAKLGICISWQCWGHATDPKQKLTNKYACARTCIYIYIYIYICMCTTIPMYTICISLSLSLSLHVYIYAPISILL